jgi:hypothetical protein
MDPKPPAAQTARRCDVFTLRHGKIIRHDGYRDPTEALKAVGLAEQAMSPKNGEMLRAAHKGWRANRRLARRV